MTRDKGTSEEEKLKKVMDNFSLATKLSVVAVNLYGEPFLFSKQYEENEFCRYIRSTAEGEEKCRKCYQKACKETFKWDEPYFFRCHAGLVMWGLPLKIDETEIGAIICGQVLLWKADHLFLSEIKGLGNYVRKPEELLSRARQLEVISARRCQASAELLGMVVEYLYRNYDYILVDQKNQLTWRNMVLSQIHDRKKTYEGVKFDYSVYLKREKNFLQYVRMEDKERIVKMFPILYTDMEILCSYEGNQVKEMVRDFMVLVSRACAEAGLEGELAQEMLRQYEKSVEQLNRSEDIYAASYRMICNYLDMIFRSGEESHTSLIQSVLVYIQEHYREEIVLEDVAEHVFLSKSYLCALFRENMNMTIHEYLTRVRVEKSIELMKNREWNIGEIGRQCGFASQSHYTRVFRKLIGVTPGQYRNKFLV